MKDLEHRTMVALAGPYWLDGECDDDEWEDATASPIDQIQAMERLPASMAAIRPAYDEI